MRNKRSPDVPAADFNIAKPELSPAVRGHLDNLQAQVYKILNKYGVSNFNELLTLGESDINLVRKEDITLLTKLVGLVGLAIESGEKMKYSPINLESVTELMNENNEIFPVVFNFNFRNNTMIISFESTEETRINDGITGGVLIGISKNPDHNIARIEAEADLLVRLESAGLKPVENS
jgi:hypothetical protein